MIVFVKLLPPIGTKLGPFSIKPDIGNEIGTTFSRDELLDGIYIKVNDAAQNIKIKSLGFDCLNDEITYNIVGATP